MPPALRKRITRSAILAASLVATSERGFSRTFQAAHDRGQDVTTEVYPYGAGMTGIALVRGT